jgi:hypothetical protein
MCAVVRLRALMAQQSARLITNRTIGRSDSRFLCWEVHKKDGSLTSFSIARAVVLGIFTFAKHLLAFRPNKHTSTQETGHQIRLLYISLCLDIFQSQSELTFRVAAAVVIGRICRKHPRIRHKCQDGERQGNHRDDCCTHCTIGRETKLT